MSHHLIRVTGNSSAARHSAGARRAVAWAGRSCHRGRPSHSWDRPGCPHRPGDLLFVRVELLAEPQIAALGSDGNNGPAASAGRQRYRRAGRMAPINHKTGNINPSRPRTQCPFRKLRTAIVSIST